MKLQDYSFSINVRSDPSLVDFITDINTILNNGRYQMRVTTSIPNWIGDDGEHLLYINGTTKRFYIYDATNAVWQYIQWVGNSTTGNAIQPGRVDFTNLSSINVIHNLGFIPIVQILDNTSSIMEAEVTHNTLNDFTVTFAQATTGAILYL